MTAFLSGGVIGQKPELIGEAYRDAGGNVYNALSVQPIIVLAADGATLAKIHARALEREIPASVYIEEMFATGHDAANRAVFAEFGPADAKVVGIALHADRKTVDRITRGSRLHA